MKLKKILKLTASLLCLVFFSNAYGTSNDNNPFSQQEDKTDNNNIFGKDYQENTQDSYSFFSNSYNMDDAYNKAGGPPGPPDDEDDDGVPIDNHLVAIFMIGIAITALFAKKYSQNKKVNGLN